MNTPKQTLKKFKGLLKKASDEFGIPAHNVNCHQFFMIAKGSITQREVMILGGFAKLKLWAIGKKEDKKIVSETAKALERLAKYVS